MGALDPVGSFDWWLVTFSFKPDEYGSCPYCSKPNPEDCKKEDGTCESWLIDADNYWEQQMLKTSTWVGAGSIAVGAVASALTAGIAAPLAVTLAGMVSSVIVGKIT